jgi:hypothetical protein
MIFFISHSVQALIPAISMVDTAINNRMGLNHWLEFRKGKNRINRNTPAVTRVEEWTRADTGVGAAMAAGSHLENGICALLVMPAMVIAVTWKAEKLDCHIWRMFQWPWLRAQAMDRRSMTSPIRLVKAVIIPAARDLGF